MQAHESNDLHACLERFRDLANANQRVCKLIQGWRPVIVISPTDVAPGEDAPVYAARVDGAIGAWRSSEPDSDWTIRLSAPQEVLRQVFSGELNPARAHLDGSLQVFAEDRDQVKLDAISLILWGV